MKTIKRKKLVLADLENKLSKYERRIQRLAEEAYGVRQTIEFLTAKAPVKEETTNAVPEGK